MLFRAVKRLLFWNYARNTWQYDVLCVLILAFIFLTPKSWFENGELRSRREHQNPVTSSFLLVAPSDSGVELETSEIERRVRTALNRPEIQVTNIRKRTDAQGKAVAYEVDIR